MGRPEGANRPRDTKKGLRVGFLAGIRMKYGGESKIVEEAGKVADFPVDLGYTPRGAIDQEHFTETSFTRRIVPQTFQVNEVALVLVDVWNFGWPDGPRMPDGEPAYERGLSHALRKRKIVENVISPVLTSARRVGIQVFHGNLDYVLMRYPQWRNSTTAEERNAF